MPPSMAATKIAAFSCPEPNDNERGPRAETGETPADAEERAPGDETLVDVAVLRQVHGATQERPGAALRKREAEEAHEDRAAHDEGERGVPVAGDIEETDHLARVGHAREDETDAEDEARCKG